MIPEHVLDSLHWLQGSPSDLTHNLRLMLLIQPNCPGCHVHAMPVANALFAKTNTRTKDFDVYCVSTAFEDFQYNNVESAQLLLCGKLVGNARDILGEYADIVPTMPFAHDILTPQSEASTELLDLALESTKHNAREQLKGVMPSDILEARLSMATYEVLPPTIATIFWTVRAQGTPAWVLHTSNGVILDRTLGHMSEEEIVGWIGRVTRNARRGEDDDD